MMGSPRIERDTAIAQPPRAGGADSEGPPNVTTRPSSFPLSWTFWQEKLCRNGPRRLLQPCGRRHAFHHSGPVVWIAQKDDGITRKATFRKRGGGRREVIPVFPYQAASFRPGDEERKHEGVDSDRDHTVRRNMRR